MRPRSHLITKIKHDELILNMFDMLSFKYRLVPVPAHWSFDGLLRIKTIAMPIAMKYIYYFFISLSLFLFYSGNVPGYQGQQEIVRLVGCNRASLWEGGGLNGRLSPRRKESHWISSLTVRFATTKNPVSYHVSCVVYGLYKLTC